MWMIVADDLTGAADAGAPFAARGYTSCIWLHGQRAQECEVPVFETSSRDCDPGEAYRRVCQALAYARGRRVFKKLDSTLKGNVLEELRAVKDSLDVESVVLAPSHPKMGRTMKDRVLYVNGESSGKKLPEAPWLLTFDCEEEADLANIVDTYWNRNVAFAGAGALAQQIAARLPQRVVPPLPSITSKVVVIAGSQDSATRSQLEMLSLGIVEVISLRRQDYDSIDVPHAALLIAGGDTARAVAARLHAIGIQLSGEDIPGIPWGTWIGGRLDGMPVATKAGGFGSMDALKRFVTQPPWTTGGRIKGEAI